MRGQRLLPVLAALGLGCSVWAATPPRQQNPGYAVVHGWPQLPAGRALGSAAGVGVTRHGTVLVFHRAARTWSEPLPLDPIPAPTIAEFNIATGKLVGEWGAGLFAMPHGLSVDSQDNVWLTDVALHQVFKFSRDGKLLMTLGARGVPGADQTHFNRPTDVAVLPDGSFYVSDGYRNTRVVKFTADGLFEFQWGEPGRGPGQFDTPHAIALDTSGRVYVADRENDRVQLFSARGRFIAQWRDRAFGRPYSVVPLEGGRTVIADGGEQPDAPPERSSVSVVSRGGDVLQTIGRWGNYDGQFMMAHDVAVDAARNLYVVDIAGRRVQKFVPRR